MAEFPFEAPLPLPLPLPLPQSIRKGLFIKTENIRQRTNCGTYISMIYVHFIQLLLLKYMLLLILWVNRPD